MAPKCMKQCAAPPVRKKYYKMTLRMLFITDKIGKNLKNLLTFWHVGKQALSFILCGSYTIHFGRLEGRETAFQCFLPKDTKCKSPGKGTQVHWNTPSCKHPTNIKIIHSVLEPQKCVFPL